MKSRSGFLTIGLEAKYKKITLLNEMKRFLFLCFFYYSFSQVKLHNISFFFKMTPHYLSDDQILSALFTKLRKKRKVNT